MKFTSIQDGAQIAYELPSSSGNCTDSTRSVRTIADVLTAIQANPPSYLPMLRTTVGRLVAFLGKPAEQLSLDLIYARREDFRPFLELSPYKENSVRAYVNFLHLLLETARGLGWKPLTHLSQEWQAVLTRASKAGCLASLKHLSQVRHRPSDITSADTDRWLELKLKQGTKYQSARTCVGRIWHVLIDCGHGNNAPSIYLNREQYGIHLSEFPPILRSEVSELLRWKSADYEPKRPKGVKIREVSAKRLQQTFCSLYGYTGNVRKTTDISSLQELLQQPILDDFVRWSLNERKQQGGPLATRIASLRAAVSVHPAHRSLDWSWLKLIRGNISCDSFEEVRARKEQKYLAYDALENVAAKIHAIRERPTKQQKADVPSLVLQELLISWLLILPWRQRNIRECRIAGPNPNLFKGKVPPYSFIDKPAWVEEEEARNPEAEFWQFRFSKDETKTGISVHALVPRPLVGLLQEYLLEYRPLLLDGRDCDTLFVTSAGSHMDTQHVRNLVSDVTLRYGGRRVTPHLFRDIVAFAYLKDNREDYLTLSKLLWHKTVATTIYYYASRYNESSGVCAAESWAEKRRAKSK